MLKTYTFSITLDELEARRAEEVLAESGLTAEGVIRLILERTAREGALPIRKTPARKKKPAAAIPGLFVEGDLFAALSQTHEETTPEGRVPDEPAAEPESDADAFPTLSLVTQTSLQEAQAMLRWRARERESGETELLSKTADGKLVLLETKQFRIDKMQIATAPERIAIIRALEKIFTVLTEGGRPEGAVDAGDDAYYLPVSVAGIPDGSLALVYEASDTEVCFARYGSPDELLASPAT